MEIWVGVLNEIGYDTPPVSSYGQRPEKVEPVETLFKRVGADDPSILYTPRLSSVSQTTSRPQTRVKIDWTFGLQNRWDDQKCHNNNDIHSTSVYILSWKETVI